MTYVFEKLKLEMTRPHGVAITYLDLTRNHKVVDVIEGLLNALSNGHKTVIPENKNLREESGKF